jgi:hypothetical protein
MDSLTPYRMTGNSVVITLCKSVVSKVGCMHRRGCAWCFVGVREENKPRISSDDRMCFYICRYIGPIYNL